MKNVELTRGLIFSQRIMLELAKKGLTREEAYSHVQTAAMNCWKNKTDFKGEICKDKKVVELLGKDVIENSFDLKNHFKNVDAIFKKVGL